MKYHSIFIFFLAFTLVACAPYNDASWNQALDRLQGVVDSADPGSLVQTDILDIQWSLLHNEEGNSNNSGLPPNFNPLGNNEESSGDSTGITAYKMEITDVNTNTSTTLTYNFRDAVNIEGTSIILLASQEDLNSSSSLVTTKVLKIDTNEETVEETSSGTTHTILGTIQKITGMAGTILLNQLRNNNNGEPISITSYIGQTEAFFLLSIEYPLPDTNPTDHTLFYATDLVQQSLDGILATPRRITNR